MYITNMRGINTKREGTGAQRGGTKNVPPCARAQKVKFILWEFSYIFTLNNLLLNIYHSYEHNS